VDRRADDPESFRGAPFRRDEPTFKLGYKEASLSVRGISVFLALAVAGIIGSNLYAGLQIQTTIASENRKITDALTAINGRHTVEHTVILKAQDRVACIVSMTIDERTKFRDRYQAGAFKQMCPWMDE